MPATPRSCSACLTSSSLNGLTTAVTSFTRSPSHHVPFLGEDDAALASRRPPGLRRTTSLERVRPSLPRAHPDQLVHRRGPHLAVADLPGRRRLRDHVDHVRRVIVGDHDVEADLRHEVDPVLGSAVDLRVPLLTAVAADLADGQTLDTEGLERLLHVLELERLDDSGDELHDCTPAV